MKRLSHLVLLANLLVSPSIAGAHEVTLDIDDAVSTACKSLDQKLSRESRSNIRIALHISNHLSLLDEQNQIGNIAVGHL
ncbi:MAG: hypothetical protein VYC39_08535 [Myxococcota bacterium]|nr:hypothetical protein [Myxococcota bacterium]